MSTPTCARITRLSRPVAKSAPSDQAFRMPSRHNRAAVASSTPIGNRPRGIYITAVSHQAVVIDVQTRSRS